MEIKTLVVKAHENAVKHGFWNPSLPFASAIALIHSELSEALEEKRVENPVLWFKEVNGSMVSEPKGVGVELADAVIRIADLCGYLEIDLEAIIEMKMTYNEHRPYKHGKKF